MWSATTLGLVFGGCCSNAIATESVTSTAPTAGILITFIQFLSVSLYALPAQLAHFPRLRQRRVPLAPYFAQVALFFVLSVLNNAAFAYHIPMSVHIVFRSGGMIVNMLLGWLLVNRRYTPTQVVSVLVVTIGIVLTTLSASKPAPSHAHHAVSLYAQGIVILALALLLSGFLGLSQDYVFARYIQPSESRPPAADPRTAPAPAWQENMFYIHALGLPLFYFSRRDIATELARAFASTPVSFSVAPALPVLTLPSAFLFLVANTVTQLLCVIGVNRLTGRVSSLTVTLILTVRKAVSLILSVAIYGGQANAAMWSGAALVFLGTVGYSLGVRPKVLVKDKKD